MPASSYFTTYGLKKSYGSVSEVSANYVALFSQTSIDLGNVFKIGTAAGGVLASVLAGASIAAGITPVLTHTVPARLDCRSACGDHPGSDCRGRLRRF